MSNICLIRVKKDVLRVLLAVFSCGVCLTVQAETATVLFARAYHVDERTRVVLETSRPVSYQTLTLKNPERLVLDMQDVKLDEALRSLADKIRTNDPYVKRVRMAYFKPGVVRVVFDLKTEVKPALFTLVPMGEYPDRLVLDIYPMNGSAIIKSAKPVESSEVLPQKLEIAQSQPQESGTSEDKSPEPVGGVVPTEPDKASEVILKTPIADDAAVTVSTDNAASPNVDQPPDHDQASFLPKAGLAITTVLAACLLLLLL